MTAELSTFSESKWRFSNKFSALNILKKKKKIFPLVGAMEIVNKTSKTGKYFI